MTIYYVRASGGSDSNNGLSYAQAFATFNKFETVAAAGDTLRIAPGTYRQTWTTAVNGTNGNPITGVGDESGQLTDGIGGEIRITGSDNDQTATRSSGISCSNNYRTFIGLHVNCVTGNGINITGNNVIVDRCAVSHAQNGINASGASCNNVSIKHCIVMLTGAGGNAGITLNHSATVDNTNQLIESCLLFGAGPGQGIIVTRIGGVTIRGNTVVGWLNGIRCNASPSVGQVNNVNLNVVAGCQSGLVAVATTDLTADYNNLVQNTTDRSNVSVGTHDVSYMPIFALPLLTLGVSAGFPGWLASYSSIAALTGSSIPTDDLFGTTRANPPSWGAVQFISGQRAYDAGYPRGGAE